MNFLGLQMQTKEIKKAKKGGFTAETSVSEEGVPVTVLHGVKDFSVHKTFDCGQCFRFEPVADSAHDEEFAGVAFGKYISVARSGENIYIYNCDGDFFSSRIRDFLLLDTDYGAIREDILSRCPTEYMKNASEAGNGIHILAQDKWEALCSFIISQNNNIPRIKKIIRALSETCGERAEADGMEKHGARVCEYSFPSAEKVASLGEGGLKALRVGFRASYIYDAATKASSGELDLEKTAELDTESCLAELCRVRGVGMKVASCTALFGMKKYDAFPIDVWIKRVLAEKFPKDFDPKTLGEYAGIAQQYMFYAARFDNDKDKDK